MRKKYTVAYTRFFAQCELEYQLEIEMAIPYYYQFLLWRVSIIVNPTSVVST